MGGNIITWTGSICNIRVMLTSDVLVEFYISGDDLRRQLLLQSMIKYLQFHWRVVKNWSTLRLVLSESVVYHSLMSALNPVEAQLNGATVDRQQLDKRMIGLRSRTRFFFSVWMLQWRPETKSSVHLIPGASVDVELEVFVNRSTAPKLNSGAEEIEDILVLHLERGKDYFIPVTGNYLSSCYGTSILSLCNLKEPVQEMPQETLRKLVSAQEPFFSFFFSLTNHI